MIYQPFLINNIIIFLYLYNIYQYKYKNIINYKIFYLYKKFKFFLIFQPYYFKNIIINK